MAERMGHLDFIILYIVVMMAFGLTSSIFYPEQYSFGEEDWADFNADEITPEPEDDDSNWWDGILDALGGVWAGLVGIATFMWSCLSFNIPMIPWIVRVIMITPFHIGMAFVIATYIRG